MTGRARPLLGIRLLAILLLAPAAHAWTPAIPPAQSPALAQATPGRPRIVLDQLTFPSMPEASYYKTYLRRSLQREAQLADWGAGSGSTIEYRFRVDTLRIERTSGLVRVSCTATGELPRGKTAVSRLSFGGDPSRERSLVQEVLHIVARGVLTRLAQIERTRRKAAKSRAGEG